MKGLARLLLKVSKGFVFIVYPQKKEKAWISGQSVIYLLIAGALARKDIVDPFCSFLLLRTPPADKIVSFLCEFSNSSIFSAYDKVTNLILDLDSLPRYAYTQ